MDLPTVQDPGLSSVRRPLLASAFATALYAGLLAVLVVVIALEDQSITMPLVILSVIGFGVAGLMVITQRPGTAWLALAYGIVTLAGDAPHQVPLLLHPIDPTHTIGAALLIVGGIASIAFAVRAVRNR